MLGLDFKEAHSGTSFILKDRWNAVNWFSHSFGVCVQCRAGPLISGRRPNTPGIRKAIWVEVGGFCCKIGCSEYLSQLQLFREPVNYPRSFWDPFGLPLNPLGSIQALQLEKLPYAYTIFLPLLPLPLLKFVEKMTDLLACPRPSPHNLLASNPKTYTEKSTHRCLGREYCWPSHIPSCGRSVPRSQARLPCGVARRWAGECKVRTTDSQHSPKIFRKPWRHSEWGKLS